MYLRICGNFFRRNYLGPRISNPKIAKSIWSANRKSANCNICERSARPVRQPYAGVNFIPPVMIYEFGYRFASHS
jgi:hypothetical protein